MVTRRALCFSVPLISMTFTRTITIPGRRCVFPPGQVRSGVFKRSYPPLICWNCRSCPFQGHEPRPHCIFSGRAQDVGSPSRCVVRWRQVRVPNTHHQCRIVFALFRAEVQVIDHAKRNAIQKHLLENITSTSPGEKLDEKLSSLAFHAQDSDRKPLCHGGPNKVLTP